MNGIHDLGGMHGFGPIDVEDHALAAWERQVAALATLMLGGGLANLDAFRYGIERMDPAHYLRASYFERWLTSLEYHLERVGAVSAGEVDARVATLAGEPDRQPGSVTATPVAFPKPTDMPEPPAPPHPRFAVGDVVVTRNMHPVGHTRLPRYARGKRGMIALSHGREALPDTNAHGLGANPQPVYNVRFDARELWGEATEARQTVAIDLWESYLEPASDAVEGSRHDA